MLQRNNTIAIYGEKKQRKAVFISMWENLIDKQAQQDIDVV